MSERDQKDRKASIAENKGSKYLLLNHKILKGMANMPEDLFVTWHT